MNVFYMSERVCLQDFCFGVIDPYVDTSSQLTRFVDQIRLHQLSWTVLQSQGIERFPTPIAYPPLLCFLSTAVKP